jgi:hypothetical protein
MVVRYIKGKYVGESRNVNAILEKVLPYICEVNCKHIVRIINQGCPTHIDFEESYENKHMVLWKGNQQTFLQFPEVTAKAMNKEEKTATSCLFDSGLSISHPTAKLHHKGFEKNTKSAELSLTH